ncbi:MAG: queuosine precursor transporter [Alphaproteobacteria bacterium]
MLDPSAFIAALNAQPPELVWLIMLLVCFSTILVMLRLFGTTGLYVYIALAVIGASLQVQKAVQFSVYADPVALGTILFASTYLCTDILAEHFGRAAARKAVWIGFASLLFFNVVMLLTLGFSPLTPDQAGDDMAWSLPNHEYMQGLFTPAPAFFAAGMIAFFASQYHDIWLFRLLSRITGGRHLWLRNNASTWVSALIDNTIFSVLAFVVLAPEPIGLMPLVFTFILGTYLLRVLVAFLDTPFVYLARLTVRGAAAEAAA